MYIIIKDKFPKFKSPFKKRFKESGKIKGIYRMHSIRNGVKEQIDEKHNLIMDDVHSKVARIFLGYSAVFYYEIKYLALGDDDTAVTGTDTILGNELFRTPFIVNANPTPKVITTDFYITDSAFVGDIEEVGIFAGSQASTILTSGNLLSHVLWEYSKTSSEELLVEYQLTIS